MKPENRSKDQIADCDRMIECLESILADVKRYRQGFEMRSFSTTVKCMLTEIFTHWGI